MSQIFQQDKPREDWSSALRALWHEAHGDWHKAHDLVQDASEGDGAWVHAYLHRVEGDLFNADYWYRRAGRSRPAVSLEQEREEIAQVLLDQQTS